jgi:cell wall-associated NlpC family hydrolase
MGVTLSIVAAVHCRNTDRRASHADVVTRALAAIVVGLTGVIGLAGAFAPDAGTSTPTTLPGPAPNQSQINAATSQVDQIEATLSQEEQQGSVLDNRYDTAVQSLQNAQSSLQTIATQLVHTKSDVEVDRRRLANDAVKAYIYGTPQTRFISLFSSSIILDQARNQYTEQIVGDTDKARDALVNAESRLQTEDAQQQAVAAQAQSEATQAKSLYAANQQEAAATQATLSQVQGQLAQEVAQAAVEEAQQEAAAAAAAASQAQAQREAAAAAAAAAVAGAVGGSTSGATATTAANQAASSSGNPDYTGTVAGTATGDAAQMAALQAAVSQLGVPYVFGGEQPGVGFDCSGLVQWAWGQAGVTIPRTTETQWPALPQVSLSALEPGDLLFYYNLDGDDQVDHVVMYAGSGPYGTDTIIQAPFTGSTVSYAPIFTEGLIGAARP